MTSHSGGIPLITATQQHNTTSQTPLGSHVTHTPPQSGPPPRKETCQQLRGCTVASAHGGLLFAPKAKSVQYCRNKHYEVQAAGSRDSPPTSVFVNAEKCFPQTVAALLRSKSYQSEEGSTTRPMSVWLSGPAHSAAFKFASDFRAQLAKCVRSSQTFEHFV